MPEGLSPAEEFQGQFSNIILASGETTIVWQAVFAKDQKTNALTNEFMSDFWEMDLEICYCSLYERCWINKYKSPTPRPKAVEQCSVN